MADKETTERRKRSSWLFRALMIFVVVVVVSPALAAGGFVFAGDRELEDERELMSSEHEPETNATGPELLEAGDDSEHDLHRLASESNQLWYGGANHAIVDWTASPEPPEIDTALLRSELERWAPLIERLEAAAGDSGASDGDELTSEELSGLQLVADASELMALLAAREGDAAGAAAAFRDSAWTLTIFDGARGPDVHAYAMTHGSFRLRILQEIVNGRSPDPQELATLRRGLGETIEPASIERLRRNFRFVRDAEISNMALWERLPLTDAWVEAHALWLYRRAFELTAHPAENAVREFHELSAWRRDHLFALEWANTPSLEQRLFFDYERSLIVRTWHELARGALEILSRLAEDGALPPDGELPDLATHDTWDPLVYERTDGGFTITPSAAWDWPNPVTWRWERPPADDDPAVQSEEDE